MIWPPPPSGGTGGGGGFTTVGSMDAQPPSVNGASFNATTIFMQSATGSNSGLVNITTQAFGGQKIFAVSPIVAPLMAASPLFTNGSGQLVSGSVSLTSQISGILPLANTSIIPIQPGGQTSGSISLTNQVSGLLPLANMNLSVGSTDAAASAVFGATLGSNSLYLQSAAGSQSGLINTSASQILGSGDKYFPGNIYSTTDNIYSIGTATARYKDGSFSNSVTIGSVSAGGRAFAILHSSLAGGGGTLRLGLQGGGALWGQLYWDGVSFQSSDSNGYTFFTFRNNTNAFYQFYDPSNQPLFTMNSASCTARTVPVVAPTVTVGSFSQTSSSGGNTYGFAWPGAQGSSSYSVLANNGAGAGYWNQIKAPTIQTLSSSGIYTLPSNPSPMYIRIKMMGGGGGGGGSGTGGGSGSVSFSGGNTIFTSGLGILNAGGGQPGQNNGNAAAPGGTCSGGALYRVVTFCVGGYGSGSETNPAAVASVIPGGTGGSGFFGGAGGASTAFGNNGAAGTGGGGSGASTATALAAAGPGGGSGGYIECLAINILSVSTASYAIGQGGAGGGAAPNGSAGGNGGSGTIIVEEYYT